jgi:hypothetical protein
MAAVDEVVVKVRLDVRVWHTCGGVAMCRLAVIVGEGRGEEVHVLSRGRATRRFLQRIEATIAALSRSG